MASSACSSRRAGGLERAGVDEVVVEAELVVVVAVRAAEECDAPHAAVPHPLSRSTALKTWRAHRDLTATASLPSYASTERRRRQEPYRKRVGGWPERRG